MVKRKEDMAVEKAERDLRRAQNAQRKLDKEERKPFLDEIKAKAKAMAQQRRAKEVQKRRISRLIIRGIKQQARLWNLM